MEKVKHYFQESKMRSTNIDNNSIKTENKDELLYIVLNSKLSSENPLTNSVKNQVKKLMHLLKLLRIYV